jgi:hypothetical protein
VEACVGEFRWHSNAVCVRKGGLSSSCEREQPPIGQ